MSAILRGALVLRLLVSSGPRVRDDGPEARNEADDHTADHQGSEAEAQDPAEDSGLGEGFYLASSEPGFPRWLR